MYGHPNLNQLPFQMKEGLFYLLQFFFEPWRVFCILLRGINETIISVPFLDFAIKSFIFNNLYPVFLEIFPI